MSSFRHGCFLVLDGLEFGKLVSQSPLPDAPVTATKTVEGAQEACSGRPSDARPVARQPWAR